MILEPENFKGKYSLSINNQTEKLLENYIEKYEKEYLIDLFGYDMYVDFSSELEGTAGLSLKYDTIYKELYYQSLSEGIEEMLKGFIFFEYSRDIKTKESQNGTIKVSMENSNHVNNFSLQQRYNRAIDSYKIIQKYIQCHKDEYPLYKGICKEKISFI